MPRQQLTVKHANQFYKPLSINTAVVKQTNSKSYKQQWQDISTAKSLKINSYE